MARRVMRTPRSLDLEITSRCNASCDYCYYLNNPGVDYRELPTQSWLDFFAELGRCKVMDVTLQGGEPLLRDDFMALVEGVVANRMRFSVLTNGRLVTADLAAQLAATGRCDQVQVSLDGSTAQVHDSLRGAGSFEPALSAIVTLRDAGLPVTVRVTVHPGNVEDLPAVTKLLLEQLALPSFSVNAASALGTASKYAPQVLLSVEQRLRAMRLLAALEAEYPGRILANAGPLADWQMFHAMEAARRSGVPLAGRGRLVGCGCIFDRLAVRADGAIIPCVMLPQQVLGRIGADDLTTVWQQAELLKGMRDRLDIPLANFAECRDCGWRESCTGNCPGTALTATGELNRPCPHACLKRFDQQLAERELSLWA